MTRKTVCEILETQVSNGEVTQELLGHFILANGKITYELASADPGAALAFERILGETILIDFGRMEVNAREYPSQWFYGLPGFLNGTMVRARILEDERLDAPDFEMDLFSVWAETGRKYES
jgi:hypothetical protein